MDEVHVPLTLCLKERDRSNTTLFFSLYLPEHLVGFVAAKLHHLCQYKIRNCRRVEISLSQNFASKGFRLKKESNGFGVHPRNLTYQK